MSEDLKYPIGKFDKNFEFTTEIKKEFISVIEQLPANIKAAVDDLTDEQLDTAYRPDGWTIRQVAHHIADSHLNAFIRFKLALTEDAPAIRPYFEDRWAELKDSSLPIDSSMKIIEGIHTRWTHLLTEMSDEDFQKKLIHPESGEWILGKMLGLYSWHSRHHTAHITSLRKRENW